MLVTLPNNGATRAKSVGNAAAMLHVPVPPMLCPVRDILLLSMPYGVTVISIRLRSAFAALPHPAVSADSCGIRTYARTSSNIPSLQIFRKAVCRRDKVEIVPFAAAAVQIDNKRHPRARLGRGIQIIPPRGVSDRRAARVKCCCCGFCRSRCGGRCCRHCSDGKCGFPAVVCVCRTAVVCRSVAAAVAAAFSVFADAEAAGKAVFPCVCKGCDIMTEELSACFTEPHPHIPTTHRFATIRYKAHLFTAKPFHRRYTNVLAFLQTKSGRANALPLQCVKKLVF